MDVHKAEMGSTVQFTLIHRKCSHCLCASGYSRECALHGQNITVLLGQLVLNRWMSCWNHESSSMHNVNIALEPEYADFELPTTFKIHEQKSKQQRYRDSIIVGPYHAGSLPYVRSLYVFQMQAKHVQQLLQQPMM